MSASSNRSRRPFATTRMRSRASFLFSVTLPNGNVTKPNAVRRRHSSNSDFSLAASHTISITSSPRLSEIFPSPHYFSHRTTKWQSVWTTLKNASLRARDLAQQLLTFARGGAPIKKTASIGKLIQDTLSFSLRGSHNRSEFELGADLSPAEIDAGQISQVIANLVLNADQAMPNGGTLHGTCQNFSYSADTTPPLP